VYTHRRSFLFHLVLRTTAVSAVSSRTTRKWPFLYLWWGNHRNISTLHLIHL